MKHDRPGQCGFTLIELMLVVAVISIIMAIAIPSFLNARMSANEASAISTMKAVVTVNEQYNVRFGSYASSMSNLRSEGYLDSSVADPTKAGYTFSYGSTGMTFTFNGDPSSPGQSGTRYFFADESGVIRFSRIGTAGSSDSALGK